MQFWSAKEREIGLITTEGFRDVLEIGRQFRRSPYELEPLAEAPIFLIPGALRKEVRERISHTGEIRVPLDEEALLARTSQLVEEGVEAIAICFLFSFMKSGTRVARTSDHSQRVPQCAHFDFV